MTLLLVGCGSAGPAEDEGGVLRIATSAPPIGAWDPAQGANVFMDILGATAVYEGLATWDREDAELVPVLARSLEVSDDATSLDVVLRDDVDFVDGSHLDAAGVVKYLEYVLGSDTFLLGGAVSRYETKFAVTSDYAFTISTAVPMHFPESFMALMELPILSPDAIDDPALVASEPVGTGPYVIDEVVPDVSMSFVRNPGYRDPEAYPYDEIVLLTYDDPVAQLNALTSGQVDVATNLTPPLAAEAENAGLAVHRSNTTVAYLNVRDPANAVVEALRDVRVRQAMMFAFDREAIAQNVYAGFAIPTIQAYVPEQAEYVEGAEDRYGYDLERARELLADAGYPDGFDLRIATLGGYTDALEPIVQQSLGEIGIRVAYEPRADDYWTATFGGEYDVTIVMGEPVVNSSRLLDEEFPGLGSVFVPTPEVSALMAAFRGPDAEEAAEAARELGEFLLDQAWYIPIVLPTSTWTSDPDILVTPNPVDGRVSFRDIVPTA